MARPLAGARLAVLGAVLAALAGMAQPAGLASASSTPRPAASRARPSGRLLAAPIHAAGRRLQEAAPPNAGSILALHVEDGSGGGDDLQQMVDGRPDSCVVLQPDPESPFGPGRAWAIVDLGSSGAIGSVGLLAGRTAAPADVQVFDSVGALATGGGDSGTPCGAAPLALQAGAWAREACNATGRYLGLGFPAQTAVEVCDLAVAFTPGTGNSTGESHSGSASPSSSSYIDTSSGSDGGGGGLSGGAIAGIAVGSAVAAAALLGALVWARHRQARLQPDAGSKAAAAAEGERRWDGAERGDGGGKGDGGTATEPSTTTEHHTQIAAAAASRPGSQAGSREGTRLSDALQPSSPFLLASQPSASSSTSGHDAGATDISRLPEAFGDISPGDVELGQLLGEGSFAKVWRATWHGTTVACKVFQSAIDASPASTRQHARAQRSLKKEASLMARLRHPNVCAYLGACEEPPCLILEYCSRGALDTLLAAGRRDPTLAARLGWERLLSMALDAAHGMAYLHTRSPPVAHRDLKSGNLLCGKDWSVKVADFGLSRGLAGEDSGTGSRASTLLLQNPRWLAPEVMAGQPGNLEADVWSWGTVMWEIASWRLPYDSLNAYQIIGLVQSRRGHGLEPLQPGSCPAGPLPCWDQYAALMEACLAPDPGSRPKFDHIAQELGAMLAAVQQHNHPSAAAAGAVGEPAAPVRTLRMPAQSAAYSAALSALARRQASMQRQASAPPVHNAWPARE